MISGVIYPWQKLQHLNQRTVSFKKINVSKWYQPHTNSHHHIWKTYKNPWWSLMNCNQEAHGGHHWDASMLQFHGSAALERSHITVRGKSYRVPKADGRLNAQLVLESGQVDLYDQAGQCWKGQATTLASTKCLYTVSMSRDMCIYGMRQSFDHIESYRMGCPVVLWRTAQIKSQIARVLCICAVDTRCLP